MEGLTIVRNRWARFAGSGTVAAGLMAALCLVLLPGCPQMDACANNPCDDGDNCTTDTCTADTSSAGFTCTNDAVVCTGTNVCNPADGECVECLTAQDCDPDDNFCDGEDTCINNACVNGPNPCTSDQTCLEDVDTCAVSCTADVDCAAEDDGLFCTGDPVCDTASGACSLSGNPCAAGEVCDDAGDQCVECLVDADCAAGETCNTTTNTCEGAAGAMCNSNGDCPDDGVFCNGDEFCNTTGAEGVCESTGDPCAAGEICNETSNMCDAMVGMTFDLTAETDTFVGTANADTFNAPSNTLGENDILDGAGGPDTLNVTLLGADLTLAAETPTLVDIETMNVDSRASANDFQVDGEQPSLVNLSGNADFSWFEFDANQETTINLNMYEDTLTLDFDGAGNGLGGMDDVLNLILTGVGTSSADVVLDNAGGDDLEELGLTSTGGANKLDLGGDGSVNLDEVTVDGDSDLTIEALTDVLDGLTVDASSLGASFVVRADLDGVTTFDLSGYTGLDMVELFDGVAADNPDINTLQEGTGVLFTETYANATIRVDGAGDAGQNNNSQTVYLAGDADVDLDDLTIDEVENITINSDTTDDTDPQDRANSIANLFANELEVLTITGGTDLSFGNDLGSGGDPVDSVVADMFTGDLAVSFDGQGDSIVIDSGPGDDDLGGSDADDVIDGNDGDDTIEGNDGDDALDGGADADTFVFEATAAANGDDDIDNFDDSEDMVDVSAFATDDDVTATVSDESGGAQATANNNIFVVTDANGDTLTDANVAALFGGTVFADPADGDQIVLFIQNGDTGDTTVWYVDESGDAGGTVQAGECVRVATMNGFGGTIGDDQIVD